MELCGDFVEQSGVRNKTKYKNINLFKQKKVQKYF